MKKFMILLGFAMLWIGCKKSNNWDLILDKNSYEPYGCVLAYKNLKSIFPDANIKTGRKPMIQIRKSYSKKYDDELIIVVANRFMINDSELEKMQQYIQLGNHVVIFSNEFSDNLLSSFRLKMADTVVPDYLPYDSLQDQKVILTTFDSTQEFIFHGRYIESSFKVDTPEHHQVQSWGYAGNLSKINLATYTDTGSITLCATPVVMTNYFFLQKNNRQYFEHLWSTFSEYTRSVTWYNEINHEPGQKTEEGEWAKLMKIPGFFWAMIISLVLLASIIFIESKRRQRIIPILPKNTNTTLEFAETIGRLYYAKKDNVNLSQKMIAYYMEHLRSKYQVKTNVWDESFIKQLSVKVNQPLEDTRSFLAYLQYIKESKEVSENDILHLHHQIKKFS